MIIKPYQTYITEAVTQEKFIEIHTEILESIGLTDITFIKKRDFDYVYSFKFPDGTQVTKAAFTSDGAFSMVYDLEAHIIVILRKEWQVNRPAPDLYIWNYMGMCLLPTSSGDVMELRCNVNDYAKTCEVFNIPKNPDYHDTANPSSCTLLPAYVGLPTGIFEILNCYVALNATYITGTKFVNETGAKWVALGGPLLYKVPTTD